jgi:hypothetical protein
MVRADRNIVPQPRDFEAWERLRHERYVDVFSPDGECVRFGWKPRLPGGDCLPLVPVAWLARNYPGWPPLGAAPALRTDPALADEECRVQPPSIVDAIAAVRQGHFIPHERMSAVAYKAMLPSAERIEDGRRMRVTGSAPVVIYAEGPGEHAYAIPRRESPRAVCLSQPVGHMAEAPHYSCMCGYHAAYSVVDILSAYRHALGVLVVVPLGKTLYHQNAWRAERYVAVAAVLLPGTYIPPDWDPHIPIIQSGYVPETAYDIARELRAERALIQEE